MNTFLTGTAIVAAIASGSTIASAQTQVNADTQAALSSPAGSCSALKLSASDVSVRLGAANLADAAVVGGPAACTGSVQTDSPNVTVSLANRNNVSVIRIVGEHEGFAKVNVIGTNGAPIGSISVKVYPREHTTT